MGTLKAPPITRLISWFAHRQTLCSYCRKEPKVYGEYCSEHCRIEDWEVQSHGG